MEKLALLALVLPAALAGCLGGEPAPVPTGQIDGAVVDQLLRPFSDQTVYLSELGWRDSTSRLGGFTFREVPVGSYTLITSHDGTRGAVAVVDVQEGHVTKIILQLLPLPRKEPTMSILPPHSGYEDVALPGHSCPSCEWTIPLDEGVPKEVTFEAYWDRMPHGDDGMRFEITDQFGDVLYQSPVAFGEPVSISIQGADIPEDADRLHVTAVFGDTFTPRTMFHMESVVTMYYGATKAELFHT